MQMLTISKTSSVSQLYIGQPYRVLVAEPAVALVELELARGREPAPRIHSREDEWYFVLSGEVEFSIGTSSQVIRSGGFAFAPRGIPQHFEIVGEPAKVLVGMLPGGFEQFFNRFPVAATREEIRDLLDVGAEFGVQYLPPGTSVGSAPPLFSALSEPICLNPEDLVELPALGGASTVLLQQGNVRVGLRTDLIRLVSPEQAASADNYFYVVKGEYEISGEVLGPGDCCAIPAGALHWVSSTGKSQAICIEVTEELP